MFSTKDQYVAPDFSGYPDYDNLERPVNTRRRPAREHFEDTAGENASPGRGAVGQTLTDLSAMVPTDRFTLILLFLILICLYCALTVSRLEDELRAMRHSAR